MFFFFNEDNIKPHRKHKGKSLLQIFNNYIVLDLETTGLDPSTDSIIELGAVQVVNGEINDTYNTLINPGFAIDSFITELTGITNEMLFNAPYISDVLPSFIEFIGDNTVVAHNANFDVNFLYDICIHELDKPFSNDFVDTVRFSRRLFKDSPRHTLPILIDYLGLENKAKHRALDDCYAVAELYRVITSHVNENSIDLAVLARKKSQIRAKDIATDQTEFDESHPVFGKVCVFTGKLDRMLRKEAMQIVADLGGICSDNVTQKTNFLIIGNFDYCTATKGGKSSKQKKAEQYQLSGLDIEIISENVFYDMVSEV